MLKTMTVMINRQRQQRLTMGHKRISQQGHERFYSLSLFTF